MRHIFNFELLEKTYEYAKETVEEEMIMKFCKTNLSEVRYSTEPEINCIPVGSVDWCEKVYGQCTPDYYPHFLSEFLYRKVWINNFKTIKQNKKSIFIKPTFKYKRWPGFVYSHNNKNIDILDNDVCYCSDVVHFINEWRYYIVNGKVLASTWYDGDISDKDVIKGLVPKPPNLPYKLLEKLYYNKYYGVIDMGELIKDGKRVLALVEACHPYAIGWYLESDSYTKYAEFLIESDKYLRSNIL